MVQLEETFFSDGGNFSVRPITTTTRRNGCCDDFYFIFFFCKFRNIFLVFMDSVYRIFFFRQSHSVSVSIVIMNFIRMRLNEIKFRSVPSLIKVGSI